MIATTDLEANADINRIVQGEAVTITVEVFDRISQQVQDFATLAPSAATASFFGTSAPVVKSLGSGVVVATDPGRLAITLSVTDTRAMLVGDDQSWQIAYTIGAVTRIVQLDGLDVVASLF